MNYNLKVTFIMHLQNVAVIFGMILCIFITSERCTSKIPQYIILIKKNNNNKILTKIMNHLFQIYRNEL